MAFFSRTLLLCSAFLALGLGSPRWARTELAPPKALQMDDLKLDWAGGGEEELPTWVSAQLAIGPDGKVTGRVVEVGLGQDGTDEDGDPLGFDTYVFEVSDGTLKEPVFDGHSFSFTCLYPLDPSWSLALAGHLDEAKGRGWTVNAVSQGKDQDHGGKPVHSLGRNRFPLISQQKDGVLQIYPQDDGAKDQGGMSL